MNSAGSNFVRTMGDAPTIAARRGLRGPSLEGVASDGWRSSIATGLGGPIPEGFPTDGQRSSGGWPGPSFEGVNSDSRRGQGGHAKNSLSEMWTGPGTPTLSPSCRSPMDRFYDPYLMSLNPEDLPTAAPQHAQTGLWGTEERCSSTPQERPRGASQNSNPNSLGYPCEEASLPSSFTGSNSNSVSLNKVTKSGKNKLQNKSSNKINQSLNRPRADCSPDPANAWEESNLNAPLHNGSSNSPIAEPPTLNSYSTTFADGLGSSNTRTSPQIPKKAGQGLRLNVSQQAPPLGAVGGTVTFAPDTIDPPERGSSSKLSNKQSKASQKGPCSNQSAKPPPSLPAGPVSPDQMARLSQFHKSQAPAPPPRPLPSPAVPTGADNKEAKPGNQPEKPVPKAIFVDLSGLREPKDLKQSSSSVLRRASDSSGGKPDSGAAPVVGRGGG